MADDHEDMLPMGMVPVHTATADRVHTAAIIIQEEDAEADNIAMDTATHTAAESTGEKNKRDGKGRARERWPETETGTEEPPSLGRLVRWFRTDPPPSTCPRHDPRW
jgi:hypothetical protein